MHLVVYSYAAGLHLTQEVLESYDVVANGDLADNRTSGLSTR